MDDRTLPTTLFPLPPLTIVCGHYGTGKTNFSLNLAVDAAARGQHPTLIDLDIVNPYFRSSEHADMLADQGVHLVSPVLAGSTLDTPSLSGEIYTRIEAASEEEPVIMDVGGDDVGATALGRFAGLIGKHPYAMLYVINRYRSETTKPEQAAEILRGIESQSHLRATAIVNNSNLKADTDEAMVKGGWEFAGGVSKLLGLPVMCTTVPNTLTHGNLENMNRDRGIPDIYSVNVYVRTPWEE